MSQALMSCTLVEIPYIAGGERLVTGNFQFYDTSIKATPMSQAVTLLNTQLAHYQEIPCFQKLFLYPADLARPFIVTWTINEIVETFNLQPNLANYLAQSSASDDTHRYYVWNETHTLFRFSVELVVEYGARIATLYQLTEEFEALQNKIAVTPQYTHLAHFQNNVHNMSEEQIFAYIKDSAGTNSEDIVMDAVHRAHDRGKISAFLSGGKIDDDVYRRVMHRYGQHKQMLSMEQQRIDSFKSSVLSGFRKPKTNPLLLDGSEDGMHPDEVIVDLPWMQGVKKNVPLFDINLDGTIDENDYGLHKNFVEKLVELDKQKSALTIPGKDHHHQPSIADRFKELDHLENQIEYYKFADSLNDPNLSFVDKFFNAVNIGVAGTMGKLAGRDKDGQDTYDYLQSLENWDFSNKSNSWGDVMTSLGIYSTMSLFQTAQSTIRTLTLPFEAAEMGYKGQLSQLNFGRMYQDFGNALTAASFLRVASFMGSQVAGRGLLKGTLATTQLVADQLLGEYLTETLAENAMLLLESKFIPQQSQFIIGALMAYQIQQRMPIRTKSLKLMNSLVAGGLVGDFIINDSGKYVLQQLMYQGFRAGVNIVVPHVHQMDIVLDNYGALNVGRVLVNVFGQYLDSKPRIKGVALKDALMHKLQSGYGGQIGEGDQLIFGDLRKEKLPRIVEALQNQQMQRERQELVQMLGSAYGTMGQSSSFYTSLAFGILAFATYFNSALLTVPERPRDAKQERKQKKTIKNDTLAAIAQTVNKIKEDGNGRLDIITQEVSTYLQKIFPKDAFISLSSIVNLVGTQTRSNLLDTIGSIGISDITPAMWLDIATGMVNGSAESLALKSGYNFLAQVQSQDLPTALNNLLHEQFSRSERSVSSRSIFGSLGERKKRHRHEDKQFNQFKKKIVGMVNGVRNRLRPQSMLGKRFTRTNLYE